MTRRVSRGPSGSTDLSNMHRRTFLGAIGGAIAGGLSIPANAQTPAVLRVAAPFNPSSLDPTTGGAGPDHVFLYPIFDTLIEADFATLEARPGLARAWNYPNPTTLVLDLQQGVTFHDGTPFDAEAVKFNLERNRQDQRSNVKADLTALESIEVTGKDQVTIRLNRPDTALPLIFADRSGMMSSPKAVQELGPGHNRRPVGTGRWKFVSWTDNDKIVVVRNDKYWRPNQPSLDGIEFSIIADTATGLRSVTAGQNDFAYGLPPQLKRVADRASSLSIATGPSLQCVCIWTHWSKPPLNDVRVRRALSLAIDRESFVKATMEGGEVAKVIIPQSHWAFDKALLNHNGYDPERAKKLLEEAGFGNGIDLNLLGYADQTATQRQEVLMEQLRKVGIRVKFLNSPMAEAAGAFFGPEKRAHGFFSDLSGRPDPSQLFSLVYDKSSYFYTGPREGIPELQAALQETRAGQDIEARKASFVKLEALAMDLNAIVPMCFQPVLDVMNRKVKGYRPTLIAKPRFDTVYFG
jgi:ABC-type transport system substrate-binding protein